MALQSMTGFSRAQGEFNATSWAWEMRSVNGKGLDVRLRIPSGFEAIEAKARSLVSSFFSRGNIQVSLQISQQSSGVVPSINEETLNAVISAAKSLQERVGGELPNSAELMAMRGVVEYSELELSDEARSERDEKILASLKEASQSLQQMRVSEGKAVAAVLAEQVDVIAGFQGRIDHNDARKPEAIKAQLQAQVSKLMEASDNLDPQRLHQEAIVLAAKADLQEEIDRLIVHVNSAQDLLKGEGPVGRKLDFLAQEFNRECNTICSKSNSAEVTSLGLDMKLIIDQFREQLQNME